MSTPKQLPKGQLRILSEPWPQSAPVGHINNVEKCLDAAAPQQFRPITLLTMPYRVWSSIRAKQCLSWLAQFAPDGLHGILEGGLQLEFGGH